MHKKRLIFTLLYADGNFMLSRNFTLQKVGNAEWLNKNYNFQTIASSIDELIILNISRQQKDNTKFISVVHDILPNIFVPIALGGGIDNHDVASYFLREGADKLVINSSLYTDTTFVSELVSAYGSQCIVASIDYKWVNGQAYPYIDNGQSKLDFTLQEYIEHISKLHIGELYLNCISNDGTGQGYDVLQIKNLIKNSNIPIIISGGAGKKEHFLDALSENCIDAASTAHLFNFMGKGLPTTRDYLLSNGIKLAKW